MYQSHFHTSIIQSCIALTGLLGLILALCSCGNERTYAQLDKQDAIEWSMDLEQSFLLMEEDAFSAHVAGDILADLVLSSDEIGLVDYVKNNAMIQGVKLGIAQNLDEISEEVNYLISQGGHYRFVRLVEKDGEFKAVFRLYGDGGFNYHIYDLRLVDGEAKAIDLFMLTTGNKLSVTFREFLLSMGVLDGGMSEEDGERDVALLQEIKQGLRLGEYEEADELYREFSKEMRESRIGMFLYIQIAMGLDDDSYVAALQDYQKSFPDDASADLLMIDVNLINGDYDACRKNIDRIERGVGGDPFLDFMRANVLAVDWRYEDAYKVLNGMESSGFEGFYDYDLLYLDCMLETGHYDDGIVLMEELFEEYDMTEDDIEFEYYPDFMESPQYQQWIES